MFIRIKILLLMFAFTASPLSWSADYKDYLIVDQDGGGDYTSIQEAINSSKSFPDRRITIEIKNGTYREKVSVHEWNTQLSLIGESRDKTIITYDDHFKKIDKGRNSTFYTATVQVDGDDFHAENLTIENSAGAVGQAVALAVNANRASFYNSRFLGNQDTLYLTGEGKQQYFKDCYIEGTTDFIFGRATAVFDNCQIHAKANSYITAASTPSNIDYGLVFIGCRLTAASGVDQVYLGRPWRAHAKTVFIQASMGAHILPQGWHNWSKPEAEKTSLYAEFASSGKGGDISKRVGWSKQLNRREAKKYTLANIFDKYNGEYWFKR